MSAPRLAPAPGQALRCEHAAACPGCPLITSPYAEGLLHKAERLQSALGRYPELRQLTVASVNGAEPFTDYRVRAKLVTDGEGRLGLFAAGTHRVVDTPGCRVLAPPVQAAATALRKLLPLDVPLAGVDLRACDGGVLLCLIVEGAVPEEALQHSVEQIWRDVPQLVGVAASVHTPGAVQLLGHQLRVLRGPERAQHTLAPGAPWHFASHGAFTQVHPGQAARLHEQLQRALVAGLGALSGQRVLELYAGSGVLGLRLAAAGARVCAVESFAPALEQLRAAAAAQGLAIEGRAQTAEQYLESAGSCGSQDVVIVNPPRRGLSPDVRRGLARQGAQRIAYISCDPVTLARDLAHLRLLGWHAERLEPFDLIPLSAALETLALLVPAAPPAPRVLYEDEQALALDKPPFESITPRAAGDDSLLGRARQTLGVPQLSPVQRLDRDTSGVCWFARRPESVPQLAAALARGQQSYQTLVRGITREKGKIARPLRDAGKMLPATTRYRRRAVLSGHSLLELWPDPGPEHQLRRHLSSLGHPVLGDERYGAPAANRHFEHRHGLDRTFLHCAMVRLDLPGGACEVRSELPGDLAAVLEQLGTAERRQET